MLFRWSAAIPSLLGSRLLLSMREYVEKAGENSYFVETYKPEESDVFRHDVSEISGTTRWDDEAHELSQDIRLKDSDISQSSISSPTSYGPSRSQIGV